MIINSLRSQAIRRRTGLEQPHHRLAGHKEEVVARLAVMFSNLALVWDGLDGLSMMAGDAASLISSSLALGTEVRH